MFRVLICITLYLLKWSKKFCTILYVHLSEFYFELDTIKDCNSVEEIETLKAERPLRSFSRFTRIKVNVHFMVPALVMLYFHLDNVYVVCVLYGHYSSTGMPELMSHRMTPVDFWDIFDLILLTVISQSMLIYAYLMLRPNVDPEYFMFAVWNDAIQKRTIYFKGKFWKQVKSDKILTMRARMRKVYTVVMVVSFLVAYSFYVGYHLYHSIRDGNLFTARNLWLTLYYQFWTFYTIAGVIYTTFYFHLLTNYFRLKQQNKLRKINSLIEKVSQLAQNNHHQHQNIPLVRNMVWNKFVVYNRKVLALFNELAVYNRFWSFLLTVVFFGFVILICFLLYVALFGQVDAIMKESIGIFYSAELFGIVVLLTKECSTIVRQNVAMHRANHRFAYIFSRTLQPTGLQLLKLSQMISNFKCSRVGFRFINNSLIDSRMFEILFGAITVLFMKIVKKKLMGLDYI